MSEPTVNFQQVDKKRDGTLLCYRLNITVNGELVLDDQYFQDEEGNYIPLDQLEEGQVPPPKEFYLMVPDTQDPQEALESMLTQYKRTLTIQPTDPIPDLQPIADI